MGGAGHDIHFTGYRETNIIVLGKCSNHHICLRFRSGWCQDIPDSSSLERKIKVCNTNRRDDIARFSENELRQQAPKHELVLLQHVNMLSKTSMTTKQSYNKTLPSSGGGTISEDIEVLYKSVWYLRDQHLELINLEQINQWLGVLGTHIEWRLQVSGPQNTSHVCMNDLG